MGVCAFMHVLKMRGRLRERFPLGTVCDIPTSTAHLDLNVLGGVGIVGRHRKHRPLRVISF